MSCENSPTCSGASMLRPNSVMPPSWNSRAIDRTSAGMVVPGRLPISNCPISRRRATSRDYRARVNPIVTSAPTRIDLAGGTIDIWPLYLFHPGAQTVNAAISIRTRARIERRRDTRIVIRSEDTNQSVEADDWRPLRTEPKLRLLSLLVHFFEAKGLTLTSHSESPAGAGIAGSSALN